MTKQELANFLEEVLSDDKYVFKDKVIVDMATYTLKKFREDKAKVLKADLLDVAQEVAEYLMPTQQELNPVETKLKVVAKEEEVEEKPKAKAKKTVKKTVKKTESEEKHELPETLETDFGTYTINTEVNSVKDLARALEEGKDLVVAVYWTKADLKRYSYSPVDKFSVKSFPLDFDISKPVYITEDEDGVHCLSLYTENMGYFEDEAFEQVDGLRYVNTALWGLYEGEVETEEEVEEVEEVEEETDTKEVKKVAKK